MTIFFPKFRPPGTCVINERCLVRTQDGYRVVSVSGVVLAQYAVSDHMAEAHAMVSLGSQGLNNLKKRLPMGGATVTQSSAPSTAGIRRSWLEIGLSF